MTQPDRLDFFKSWVADLIGNVEKHSEPSATLKIMEACGRNCAFIDKDRAKLLEIKKRAKNIEELLALMNKNIKWCGEWKIDKDTIYAIGRECGCPLVRHGFLKLSPTLCLCSRGWVKTMFQEALEKEVEVDLVRAIGRGDAYCEFRVKPMG